MQETLKAGVILCERFSESRAAARCEEDQFV